MIQMHDGTPEGEAALPTDAEMLNMDISKV